MSLSLTVARGRANGRGMPGVGDPGLFGSIGSILGKVAGVAKRLPGPIGWAGSAVQKITGALGAPKAAGPSGWEAPVGFPRPQLPQVPTPGIRGFVQRGLVGGETGYETAAPPIGAPSGYHVNKTAYFLKDGTYVPEGSRWVKNRHRNPLNPRAASRAIGRIEALKRATSRFSRITIRKKCA